MHRMTEGLQRLMHKEKNTKAKKISDAPVLISDEKRERFHNALLKVTSDRERPTIGTLSEKTIHAVIKLYTEPDEDRHEIPIGTHVADIFSDETIYEIFCRPDIVSPMRLPPYRDSGHSGRDEPGLPIQQSATIHV